jgi:hypothetical protein
MSKRTLIHLLMPNSLDVACGKHPLDIERNHNKTTAKYCDPTANAANPSYVSFRSY